MNNADSSFLRVLLALKDNVMRNSHCADLGIVKTISNNKYSCELLSVKNALIECRALTNLTLAQNDVVLIVYTDHAFENNLRRLSHSQATTDESENELHSQNYGIIIGIVEEHQNGSK